LTWESLAHLYLNCIAAGEPEKTEETKRKEQGENRVTRMAKAERGLRKVVDEREKKWKRGNGQKETGMANIKQQESSDSCKYGESVEKENEAGQEGVRAKKIKAGIGCPEPDNGSALSSQLQAQEGMAANEGDRRHSLFPKIGGFTKFRIEVDLFVACDAIDLTRMLIVDGIIAHPKFEGEVGAERNEAVKLNGVAEGPGQADHNGENKCHKDG